MRLVSVLEKAKAVVALAGLMLVAPQLLAASASAIELPRPRPTVIERNGVALSTQDRRLYRDALAAAEKGRWNQARQGAARRPNGLTAKIIDWMYFSAPGTGADFAEISKFIEQNPDWPRQTRLRRNAERVLSKSRLSDEEALAWYQAWPPVSGVGRARLAEAKINTGAREAGLSMLRTAWIEGNFTRARERELWRKHRRVFSQRDNIARLDRLIWERRRSTARRMLSRVGPAYRRVGLARIALMDSAGNVDSLIRRVPTELKDDAGLAFERVRWRRRKGFDERAREILLDPPEELGRPDKWWTERRLQVRRALREGLITDAYRIANEHGMAPGGADYADAEWTSGWIALRFLEDKSDALAHFERVHESVNFPISVARASYWAGRAADAINDAAAARAWYDAAAVHGFTYYGQLARAELVHIPDGVFPRDPMPTIKETERFRENELAHAARLLAALGYKNRITSFVLRLEEDAKTPGERELVAALALRLDRPDLSVRVAKKAAQDGVTMVSRAYPLPGINSAGKIEFALALAIARQESQFNPQAISPAGARGLMQLMPGTANRVAKRLKIRYSRPRLTSDPDYNVRLGSAHLGELLRKFDGSYAMAIAAYNAGEGRVNTWVRENGDPRSPNVDEVDWIEMIPFDETRNYVQRVLENLVVYRLRLAPPAPLPPPPLPDALSPAPPAQLQLRLAAEGLHYQ